MNRVVNPPELPKPSGFSHAVVAGNTVYLAGQVGDGETLVDQFDGAAANLLTALRAAGGDASDLVSLQVFVVDVRELFTPELKVELMGVAVIGSGGS